MADIQLRAIITAEDRTAQAFKSVGSKMTNVGKTMTRSLTLPIVAGFGAAIRSAVKFESSFAGVRKTVDATEEEFAALAQRNRELALQIPTTVTELNRIQEMAGQLGVRGVNNLTKFTETVAKIAVTTNLTEESAATSFARIANIMQEPIENIDQMASSVVDLGNNMATTESEVVEFATRIAGAGKIAGLTTQDLFAIGAAMSSVGVQAEAGGTSVQKVLNAMTAAVAEGGEKLETFAMTAGMSAGEFKKAFADDAAGAFNEFVQGLGREGDNAFQVLKDLGLRNERVVRAFLSLANAGDLLEDSIKMSNKAFGENLALNEEAEKRFATTESQLKIARNNFEELGIVIGTELIPVLIPLVQDIVDLIKKFADLDPNIRKNIVRALALAAAIGPLLTVLGSLIRLIGFAKGAFIAFANIAPLIKGMLIGVRNQIAGLGLKLRVLSGMVGNSALWTAAFKVGIVAAAIWATSQVIKAFNAMRGAVAATEASIRASANVASGTQSLLEQAIAAQKAGNEKKAKELFDAAKTIANRQAQQSTVGRQHGGTVRGGSAFMVGEAGPELFIPPSGGGRIVPNNQITNKSSVSLNVNIGMFAGTPTERRRVAQELFKSLQDVARQKGISVGEMI